VSSLAALAAGIRENDAAALALPLIDARRGEVFAALYDGPEAVWPPVAVQPDALVARLREGGFRPLAAGDGSLRFRGMLEEAGIPVEPDDSDAHVVRALHICRLGRGAPDEPAGAVLPEYLREPDAKPQQ
jgi:tRNA threonylcarbamoyladenosine biosynthesis protein TsaB